MLIDPHKLTAWDTETFLFSPARKAPKMVCSSTAITRRGFVDAVGLAEQVMSNWMLEPVRQVRPVDQSICFECDSYTSMVCHADDEDLPETLAEMFSSHIVVGANIAYDLAVAIRNFPELIDVVFDALEENRIWDVQINQKLIDNARGNLWGYYRSKEGENRKIKYSLADLARRFLTVEMDKATWRLGYAELYGQPIEEWPRGAIGYSRMDSEITLAIAHLQNQVAEKELEDSFRQTRAAMSLHLASCWGIRTDGNRVKALKTSLEERLKVLRRQLIDDGLLNPKTFAKDTKAAKAHYLSVVPRDRVLFTDKGEEMFAQGMTRDQIIETGAIKMDQEAFSLAEDDPVLHRYSEYSGTQKLMSTYVSALEEGMVFPIHTWFEVMLETGRTSSSGPNIQNLPRANGVRECFVPRPGYCFIACDFDKAELVSLAQVCIWVLGHSRLGERLRAGFDPHLDMGAKIINKTYEEAKKLLSLKDVQIKDARQMAKAANFGYPGGLGWASFMVYAKANYGVILNEMQAKRLKNQWFETWPEMPEYFRFINGLMDGNNTASIMQFVSKRLRGRVSFTQTANGFFQGLTADAAKAAMWEVCKEQYAIKSSPLYGSRTVNFVHDEIIAEVPLDRAHDAAIRMEQVMVAKYNEFTPDVPVTATAHLMDRWYKGAYAVYDANGRMIPYSEAA